MPGPAPTLASFAVVGHRGLRMLLGSVDRSRDNNLNLIRLAAALMVLVSHSYVLAPGGPRAEPWHALGITPGAIAVDVFFFCSGLLVMSSWWHVPSLRAFALARAARVLPGLWAMVALSVPVLYLFSKADAAGYFGAPETWIYVLKNSTLFGGTTGLLPRVFEDNPFAGAVNGSLWTLPHEVRCYALLAAVGVVARLAGHRQRQAVTLAWALLALGAAALLVRAALQGADDPRSRLLLMFSLGALAYQGRDRLRLRAGAAFACVAVLAAGTLLQSRLYTAVYPLPLAYLVLALAYLPGGALRQFNRLGDYSYGVYIYAFPVQQAVTALQPQIGLGTHIAVSTLFTLVLAVLSWHAVEKPALAAARRWRSRRRAGTGTPSSPMAGTAAG